MVKDGQSTYKPGRRQKRQKATEAAERWENSELAASAIWNDGIVGAHVLEGGSTPDEDM